MKKFLTILVAPLFFIAVCGIAACTQVPLPSTPENLQWDKENWTISWDEAENAASYKLYTDESEEIFETTQTEYDFEHILTTDSTNIISVCAVNSKGETSDWVQIEVKTETPTIALKYTLLSDGSGYEVTRYYSDVETGLKGRVVIADYYEGLPVTSIAAQAFYKAWTGSSYDSEEYNTVTTSIHLPKYLETIGGEAFYKCTALQKIKMPDTVTGTGTYTFYECESLKEVKLSASITRISSGLLYGTAITEITIPESVKKINASAFRGCEGLTVIDLPENVTEIGESAFYGCLNLTSFTVNQNITSIGSKAFYGCIKLLEVCNLSSLEIEVGSQENGYVAYYAQNVCTDDSESTVIEQDDCRFIYDGCKYYLFNYTGSGELNLSALIVNGESHNYEIYNYAFYLNQSITGVTMDEYVTGIGEYAFAYCTSLKYVTLPDNLQVLNDYTFSGCSELSSVYMPELLTEIGSKAFHGCYSLYSIVIGENVTSIGASAFFTCYNLVEVYNLSSLEISMGASRFGYVATYAEVLHTSAEEESIIFTYGDYTFCHINGTYYLLGYNGTDTEIVLPTLTLNGSDYNYEIYSYAFYENTKIISVTIPGCVTDIGNAAFSGCSSLENVIFENVSGWYVAMMVEGVAISDPIGLSQTTMSNAQLMAEYLTDKYKIYCWYCS